MAVDWKGGLGGAAQGAAIGSAVPVIGTGVGAVVGGLLGLFGGGEDDAAAEAQRKAIEAIQSLDVDDLSKQALLQQYMTGGKLDPELVEKLNLNADQKMVLTEKPETIAKQTYALNALKQMAQGTGMSAESLAQMQQLTGKLSQDRAAASADVLAKAQARGTLGSGEMLAAQLGASQLGSQEASENAINIAAQAEKARKDALSQYRGLAGEMRTAEFDTMQKNLQNELARQRFLDENSLAAQKANVAQRQRANEYNLQRQQNVSDLNVQAANQEAIRSANLRAELAYKKAMGLSNAYGGSRDFEQKRAEAEAASDDKFWSGLTTGVKSLSNEGVFGKTGKDSEYDTWGILGGKKAPISKTNQPTSGYGLGSNLQYTSTLNPKDFMGRYDGGRIEGESPFKGDHPANDIVDAKLSPGEIVVPRTKAEDPKKAKSYIDDLFEKEKVDKKDKKGYDRNEAILDLIAKLHSEKK